MLATLGLSPAASAASPRAAVPHASNSLLQRWARDTWHSLVAMTPEHRPAGGQHPRVARGG